MQVGPVRRSVARVRLVIAAARANRPRPAGRAVGLARDVMRLQELLLLLPRHAVADRAERMIFRPGETMAERDLAVGRYAHQADARTARIRLRMPMMQLLQR